MATRIQVRRGTAAQWNTSNTVLDVGEFGFNTTTYQLKIGNGSSSWNNLDYIPTADSLTTSLGSYIELSEKGDVSGVAELDASRNILAPAGIVFEGTANDHETTLTIVDPTADRTITLPDATGTVALTSNLSAFATTSYVSNSVSSHAALTATHGVAGAIVGTSDAQTLTNKTFALGSNTVSGTIAQFNTAVTDADFSTLAGTETLTNKTIISPLGLVKGDVGLGNVDNTSDTSKPVSTATQTALDLKANLAGATFTGALSGTDLTLSGNLTVNGTTTNINSTNLVVEDKNIVIGDTATPSDITADGGGITLKGTTDKTFTWSDSTDSWSSSEHISIASGKSYKINGTNITAAVPALTWGDVKNGKSGLVIS